MPGRKARPGYAGSKSFQLSEVSALPQQVNPQNLAEEFAQTRAESASICAKLEIEDHVVQPATFVSPPKWHLAHTTWFFDHFVLTPAINGNTALIPDCNLLFNS